jgi:lipoprotein-anchoring transpeptidase ErfK/SrfK
MKSKTKNEPAKVKGLLHIKRRALIFGAAMLVGLVAVVAGLAWFYNGRALPNVAVAGVQVGQATVADIQHAVEQKSNMTVTFMYSGQHLAVPLKDLGVTVDTDATVEQALQARRSGDPLQNIELWRSQAVPLVFINDPGLLKKFIQEHYPSLFVDAQDAQLTYNAATKQFDIIPGTNGKGFDIKQFESSLPDLAQNPRDVTLTVASAPVEPLIQAKGLVSAQREVNQRIHSSIRFMLDGKEVRQATPDDIASWAFFTPDTVHGTARLEFDKAKIKQFITDVVSPTVAVPPIERKVVVDKESGSENVLSEGRAGWEIKDADILADHVLGALSTGKALDQAVSITEAPFKTVTMTGYGKWIEVDLSKQRAYLYVGDTVVNSFLISSGKANTPTQIGEGKIYAKYPMQTMTGTIQGEHYYVPNIKWVSYFDGGEAFHGTYWHHNFGHPMSHGCINMTEADAKVVYDFAPIGTKVIVHE